MLKTPDNKKERTVKIKNNNKNKGHLNEIDCGPDLLINFKCFFLLMSF